MTSLTWIFLVVIITSATAVRSYDITPSKEGKLGTHQWIAVKAIKALKKANYHEEAKFFQGYQEELMKGTNDADVQGGEFKILGKEVPRDSFSHFYNPDTGEGLRTDPKAFPRWAGRFGYLSMVIGPGMPSTSMTERYYEEARQIMQLSDKKEGDHESLKKKAMMALGYAQHYIGDSTVPQHATDCGAERLSDCRHTEYETFVQKQVVEEWDDIALEESLPTRIDYSPGMAPADYVIKGATISAARLDDARSINIENMRNVAEPMLLLAIELVAGLYKRFYDQWKNEKAAVVLVRIDRLKERKGQTCEGDDCDANRDGNIEGGGVSGWANDADFMPEVQIDDQEPEIRGWTVGVEDVKPRSAYDANGWTFARRVDRDTGSVKVKICIWDVQKLTGEKETQVDLNKGPGKCVQKWHSLKSIQHEQSSGCEDNGECHKAADIHFTITSVFPINETIRHGLEDEAAESTSASDGGPPFIVHLFVFLFTVTFLLL